MRLYVAYFIEWSKNNFYQANLRSVSELKKYYNAKESKCLKIYQEIPGWPKIRSDKLDKYLKYPFYPSGYLSRISNLQEIN